MNSVTEKKLTIKQTNDKWPERYHPLSFSDSQIWEAVEKYKFRVLNTETGQIVFIGTWEECRHETERLNNIKIYDWEYNRDIESYYGRHPDGTNKLFDFLNRYAIWKENQHLSKNDLLKNI